MPQRWQHAVQWYHRASREVTNRRTAGELILAMLDETRGLLTIKKLQDHYWQHDLGWPANPTKPLPAGSSVRLAEDAAYGPRWIEMVSGTRLDPRRSLDRKLPRNWVEAAGGHENLRTVCAFDATPPGGFRYVSPIRVRRAYHCAHARSADRSSQERPGLGPGVSDAVRRLALRGPQRQRGRRVRELGHKTGLRCARRYQTTSHYSLLHEIIHTAGVVPRCAPHETAAGHVSDAPNELMASLPARRPDRAGRRPRRLLRSWPSRLSRLCPQRVSRPATG